MTASPQRTGVYSGDQFVPVGTNPEVRCRDRGHMDAPSLRSTCHKRGVSSIIGPCPFAGHLRTGAAGG
jgi:hypothetical protein